MKKKEEKIYKQQENKLKLVKSKDEIMEKYKENLPEHLEEKLAEISEKLATTEEMKGMALLEINEIIRAKNFFGSSPKYSADELAIIFAYYRQAMAEINKYTKYIPSKENFCAFAGIATTTYNSYLFGADEEKADIMVQIDDYIKETMLTLAQLGEIKEVSTIFRGKASHGMVEASAPQIVEHRETVDMSSIQKMIETIRDGKTLKGKK